MTADAITTLVVAVAAFLSAVASQIKANRNGAKIKSASAKIDNALEDCESAKNKLRKELRATQEDRDKLRERLSAMETEVVILYRLLPGGDIAKRLGIGDWTQLREIIDNRRNELPSDTRKPDIV